MRLDKYISNATDLSRNEVKRLIKAGLVEIDGQPADSPAIKLAGDQRVTIEDAPICTPGKRYLMLNKPAGVVSATKDSDHPTAIDLIYEHRNQELQIAGRLDIDATGLLLLTDDGQWNHRITSPNADCQKTYLVELAEPVADNYSSKLAQGIWLEGEKRRCLPASMAVIAPCEVELTISEGKYHQVKRMFAALGNRVTSLHRLRIGEIELDPDLEPGEYRALTDDEINGAIPLD